MIAALFVLLSSAGVRADFAFPEGSFGVRGLVSALVEADIEPDGAISDDAAFGPTSSFYAELAAPNGSHAGTEAFGFSAAGVSATPQSIKAYAAAQVHPPYIDWYPRFNGSQGYTEVYARESAMLDFTANPDLAGPSFIPLMLTYNVAGSLAVSGSELNTNSFADVAFSLEFGGYFDTLAYSDAQVGGGSKSISESLDVRIAAEPTDNPLIYLATWEVLLRLSTQAYAGGAAANFSNTASLTSLTFANGQSLEALGVQVTFASGGLTAPDLIGPPDFGGGAQPVPEPSTLAMFCTGSLSMFGYAAIRRRRR